MESEARDNRILTTDDGNIASLRARYPEGLHFVVGDTHGEYTTLRLLMEKIAFDPEKDHVYFVGDYNAGGDPRTLLSYIARYYQPDCSVPGFHLIRGNHERELYPAYELKNLPDIIVIRGRNLNFHITHAGMVEKGLELIYTDMLSAPEKQVFSYALREDAASYRAPLNQITWSSYGLYSQRSAGHVWPSRDDLYQARACIIHGHTPFCMMKRGSYFSYGDEMLFWDKQKIWFAEDLQSFDIDSNVKGRYIPGEPYRGLSCVCLEGLEEIAEEGGGTLRRDVIRGAENFVFGVPYRMNDRVWPGGDINRILFAKPEMKTIGLNAEEEPEILEEKRPAENEI